MKQIYRLASIFLIMMLLGTVVTAEKQTTSSNKDTNFVWDIKLCSVNSRSHVEHCGDTVFNIPKNKDYVKIRLKLTYKNFPRTLQPYATLRWNDILSDTDPGKMLKPYKVYKLNYKRGTITNTVKIYRPGTYLVVIGPAMCGANCRVYYTIK